MRILSPAAAFAALAGLAAAAASPAAAATGQCYDRHGRAVGAPFDTFYPNRRFIDQVIARGGTCTVSGDSGAYHQPRYAPAPGSGYYYRDPVGPGGQHANWCDTNPPSGYCIVPEFR